MASKTLYLQMCLDECLRLYPPGTRYTDFNKTYVIIKLWENNNIHEIQYNKLRFKFFLYLNNDTCFYTRIDRLVEHNFEIDGVPFVSGMKVIVPVYAMNHDPENWPDPEKFNPER